MTEQTLLSKIDHEGDRQLSTATPKQRLVILKGRGLLSDLQLRGMAQQLDAAITRGATGEEAYKELLVVYDSGELKLGDIEARKIRPPSIYDAAKGDTPAQMLLWLEQRGSLSREQVRIAAGELKKIEGEKGPDEIAAVLHRLGFYLALPADYEPDYEPEEETPETPPQADEAALQRESEMKAHVHGMNVEQATEFLGTVDNASTLELIRAYEAENPAHAGGRKGLMHAIDTRIAELALGAES